MIKITGASIGTITRRNISPSVAPSSWGRLDNRIGNAAQVRKENYHIEAGIAEQDEHYRNKGKILVLENLHHIFRVAGNLPDKGGKNAHRGEHAVPELGYNNRRNRNGQKYQHLKDFCAFYHAAVKHICQKKPKRYLSEHRNKHYENIVPEPDMKDRVGQERLYSCPVPQT